MEIGVSEKRVISNEEYDKAYANQEYRKVMYKASHTFTTLSSDARKSCMMEGLWLALIRHKEGYGSKFTTSLYKSVQWECLKALREAKKYGACAELQDVPSGDSPEYLTDCLGLLPAPLREVIRQRFYLNMTLREIGSANGYSQEMARLNIKKGLQRMNQILSKSV